MDWSVKQTIIGLEDTRDALYFCERTAPLLIHLQLCEGLRIFAADENLQSSFLNFDRDKIDEIMAYITNGER
jgi:hypothetical protein